jgi:hypothetical protein
MLRYKADAFFVVFLVIASCSATVSLATTPPNPERLLKSKTCFEAKRNLTKAREGSPLISAEKMAKIVTAVEGDVKRLCAKQR